MTVILGLDQDRKGPPPLLPKPVAAQPDATPQAVSGACVHANICPFYQAEESSEPSEPVAAL